MRLLVLLCICLTSCDNDSHKAVLSISFPAHEQNIKIEEVKTFSYIPYKKFDLDGHKYICFPIYHGENIIHDPDCPCKNKE